VAKPRTAVLLLAALALLMAAAAAKAFFLSDSSNEFPVGGKEEDIYEWVKNKVTACTALSSGRCSCSASVSWSQWGSVRVYYMPHGALFDFLVQTGIPRIDAFNQAPRARVDAAATQWANPNPLRTYHRFRVEVRYSVPSGWKYHVTMATVTCKCCCKDDRGNVQCSTAFSDSLSVVDEFEPLGAVSGSASCDLNLDAADRGSCSALFTVPWYGKTSCDPGDFGAKKWQRGVKPRGDESTFGRFYVRIYYDWNNASDGRLRFYMMSGLTAGSLNPNPEGLTEGVKIEQDYLDYAWFIAGGSPSAEIRTGENGKELFFSGATRDHLYHFYEDSEFEMASGRGDYEHPNHPVRSTAEEECEKSGGVCTWDVVGVPLYYIIKGRVLPKWWGALGVSGIKNTVPEIKVAEWMEVRRNDTGLRGIYVGFDPDCNYTRLRKSNAAGGCCGESCSCVLPGECAGKDAPPGSCNGPVYDLLAADFGYDPPYQVAILAHLYKEVKPGCRALAVAYVVNVPNGRATALMSGAAYATHELAARRGAIPWLVPYGGMARATFDTDFDYEWAGEKRKPEKVPGTEGVEMSGYRNKLPGWRPVEGQWYRVLGIRTSSPARVDFAVGGEHEGVYQTGMSDLVLSPWVDLKFGDEKYVVKTHLGDLEIPAPVVPNWYIWQGTRESYSYYFATTKDARDASYMRTASHADSTAAKFIIDSLGYSTSWGQVWYVGTAVRNFNLKDRDGFYVDGYNFAHAKDTYYVRYSDVWPMLPRPVTPPPQPPPNATPPGGNETPPPNNKQPPPPPPQPCGNASLYMWLVPAWACEYIYCPAEPRMYVAPDAGMYAFANRSYIIYAIAQSENGREFRARVTIRVPARAIVDRYTWYVAGGDYRMWIYYDGELEFAPEGRAYFILPNRTLTPAFGALLPDRGWFVTPARVGGYAVEYSVDGERCQPAVFHVTPAALYLLYFTPNASRIDYVRTAIWSWLFHYLADGTYLIARYRPEWVLHAGSTEAASMPWGHNLHFRHTGVLGQYSASELVRYSMDYYPVASGPARAGTRALLELGGGGEVRGWLVYTFRDGAWRPALLLNCRSAALDLTEVYPWDPVLVVPAVRVDAMVRDGDRLRLPMPEGRVYARWWPPLPPPGTPSRVVGFCRG
jgi:hypothetical protein